MKEMCTINFHTKYSTPFIMIYFISISSRELCKMFEPQFNALLVSKKNPKAVVQCYVTPVLKGNCRSTFFTGGSSNRHFSHFVLVDLDFNIYVFLIYVIVLLVCGLKP